MKRYRRILHNSLTQFFNMNALSAMLQRLSTATSRETSTIVYRSPVPSSKFTQPPFFQKLDEDIIRFCFASDGIQYTSGLAFSRVGVLRFYSVRHFPSFRCNESLDCLLEIHNSAWQREVTVHFNDHDRRRWDKRHYRIFLEGFGFYDCIASSWEILPVVAVDDLDSPIGTKLDSSR
jgi:hypothetical protein